MNFSSPFEWLIYQQDYLWFLTVFGWGVLLVAWLRLGRLQEMPLWLPIAAGASLWIAGLEISQLITPVEQRPFTAPWLRWDLALGGVEAALTAGFWWVCGRTKKWAAWKTGALVLLTVAAAVVRYSHPAAGSLVITVLFFAAIWLLVRSPALSISGRTALLLLGGALLFATNGPCAELGGISHRYNQISPYGLVAAGCLLASAVCAASELYRQAGMAASATITQTDLALLIRAQALWLLAGLVLAGVMSKWARTGFEENLLSRAQLSAELIDTEELAASLGPEFRVDWVGEYQEYTGRTMPTFSSHYLAQNQRAARREDLARIELANPKIDWALILTMRDGWLVQYALSSRMPKPPHPGEASTYGRPDAATWQSWSSHQPEVLAPANFFYGTVVQARAPLLSRGGRMLGWLVFDGQVAYWLAAQVQARLLAFLVIALGSALLVANWQQRLRERVRAAARREADAALAANRMKASFLAKVSHELRTPIQSLLGYSELLRLRIADDPKAAGWLAALRQHGELMTRLVNDLIDLGAVEAGAFKLAARPVEPADIVAQTVESFRPRAESRALTLACFVDPAVPAWVSLDGERFRQVLTNLVGNALKFTDRGGVTVTLRPEGPARLALIVRDTGPGISPEDQARLFVAFSRLEASAAKEGTGLGLALSAALCNAMGGSLTVASDGVAGSCFTAVFGAPAVAAPADTKVLLASPVLRGRRILVVDDNPLVRELFIAFLTEQGAMCAAATTGAEALAQGDASGFDAIILDLALPDGDGTEFVRPLRARAQAARLIGVSAHASAADRERALKAGMDAFLTKPVSLGSLAAAVVDAPAGSSAGYVGFRTADALRERLARQFARELPAQRAALGDALAARDWYRVETLAHHLKNSAVVVRDDALFDVCTGLEQAATGMNEASALYWWGRCAPHLDEWIHGKTPKPLVS